MLNPAPLYQHFQDIYFLNADTGWAAGNSKNVLYTTDGGENWKVVDLAGKRISFLSSISFTDPKNGWIAGISGVIIHTCDGGRTWNSQSSQASKYLFDVFLLIQLADGLPVYFFILRKVNLKRY